MADAKPLDASSEEEPSTLVLPENQPAGLHVEPKPMPIPPDAPDLSASKPALVEEAEKESVFQRLWGKLSKPKEVVETLENLIPQEKTTLELRYELIEAVEQALRPHRRRNVEIPYNLAFIHIFAPQPQEQQKYVAAISDIQPSLQDAVLEKLISGRYSLARDFQVDMLIYPELPDKFIEAFKESNVFIELAKRTAATLSAKMTVIKGGTSYSEFTLKTNQAYNVGRLAEILNERGQLVRQNHIVFIDPNQLSPQDPNRSINDTVSRMHGRIVFDNKRSKFVYYNEQGSTSLYRTGFTASKKLVTGQSVPLEAGDVLYWGSACVRFDG